MGVYIQLNALVEHITEQEWSAVYDEALDLLKSQNIMGIKQNILEFENQHKVKRTFYSTDIEKNINDPDKQHWDVVGDINSLLTAESFWMYRKNQCEEYEKPGKHVDIIEELINEIEDKGSNFSSIFNNKTQGYPYHYSVLAVGMLLEDRFPKYAVVSGDIDRYQAIKSQKIIKDILNKDVQLPVVTEWEKLIDRIIKFRDGIDAIEAFSYIVRDDQRRDGKYRFQAIAKKFSKNDFHSWIVKSFNHYESPTQNGSLNICIDWLNAGFDIKTLTKLACVEKDGPQFKPDEFVKALVESLWVTTPMDKREQLDIFQKPKGEVDRVSSQFGMAMFEMMGGLKGRDLNIHIPENQFLQELEKVFPDNMEQLSAIVSNPKNELEENLSLVNEKMKQFKLEGDEIPEEISLVDGTEYFTLNEQDSLSEMQEYMLLSISLLVNKLEEQIQSNDEISQIFDLNSGIDQLRFVLAKMTNEFGPMLTENAWNWIDQENDVQLLKTLCFLAVVNEREQKFYNTKKSIFEKRWLCKIVTDWSKDDDKLEPIRKMAQESMDEEQD